MIHREFYPPVSVVINTDARVKSLTTCLESLRYLRYPNFEVVVVAGPTRDGTHELCDSYGSVIRYAQCPIRNLSLSRNIGIANSAGEFIAFLDDDSVPEPEWLSDLIPMFIDGDVAVAGGFLHDHTGKGYQWMYGTLNRFGTPDQSWGRATPEFNFPGSFNYPHVMANSVFRRSAIAELGGFDEEYEYFLDESDLILRLVDAGFKVAQVSVGFVHHKYLASDIRDDGGVLTNWYSLVKNKVYFSILNAGEHAGLYQILLDIGAAIERYRHDARWAVEVKGLDPVYMKRFESDVNRALRDGLNRGLAGVRRIWRAEQLRGMGDILTFKPLLDASCQRCFVVLCREYDQKGADSAGADAYQFAASAATDGHQVHVLTAGQGHDRVDFEDGVWVHRLCIREFESPLGGAMRKELWNYSRSMFEEAIDIAARRRIDAVFARIGSGEEVAFEGRSEIPPVMHLHEGVRSLHSGY